MICISAFTSYAQSIFQQQIEALVKQEGEIFIVVSHQKAGQTKSCLEEDALSNQISFIQDSAFVQYVNHTELFCETYVLHSQFTYKFSLKDIEATSLRLIEKKYDYGEGKLEQGPDTWYELELISSHKKFSITKVDMISKQTENIASVNLLFKSKNGAKEAMALFKNELKRYGL
ncbi:hypothetical protein GXP67_30310 [Rhodocytophaga rosea]|uniref:Uncharacterized protein n=1 Tax=Rhodocytophaga rosea TaxID=2704465 RepID=A0A6C0GT80_9BACT|nr:hypothetical protein [Rhodocytophaga rosea]QHT70642.1 hypothetical protein GXP67_30310 [Rhodocytophaga rosea]